MAKADTWSLGTVQGPSVSLFLNCLFDPTDECCSQDRPEYYAMGHDMATPLFDSPLWSAVGPRGDVSFLLCGSGDARHFFSTIVGLGMGEIMGRGKKMFRKAHFTLLDINATALARMLVMFDMVYQYGAMKLAKLPRIEDALTVMGYLYSSAFIPAFVAQKMEEHIRTLIDELESGEDILETIYVPQETRDEVIRKLKRWLEPLGDDYSPKKIRTAVVRNFIKTEQHRKDVFGEEAVDAHPDSKNKEQDYRDFGVIFAPDVFIERREPALRPLLDAFRSGSKNSKKTPEEYIDSNWKTNPTVLDMDYEPRR